MKKNKILLICGSRKPSPGSEHKKSAVRELLKFLNAYLKENGEKTSFIDLRNLSLPMFDGRNVTQYGSKDLIKLKRQIQSSNRIIISVPAYWGGIAGIVKNMLDVLGGPGYDDEDPRTIFENKTVGLLVVGSDEYSAYNAGSQMRTILSAMGAKVLNTQAIIGNPRNISDSKLLAEPVKTLGEAVTKSENSRIE